MKMNRRQWIQNGWGLGLTLAGGGVWADTHLRYKRMDFLGLGTTLSIQAAHHEVQHLDEALQAARQCVALIEAQMSLFQPHSTIQMLNRAGVLENPPAYLHHVLMQAQMYAKQSHGAFDATVQPLWALFAQAQSQGRLPSDSEIQNTKKLVNWRDLSVSPQRIALARPGMGVTLNGIAQGFASDEVKRVLQSYDVQHALINMGEWRAMGHSPRQSDWMIGVSSPRQNDLLLARLHVSDACVATSADDQSTFSNDHVHHHIFDPHTGYSPRDVASVTVVAPTCIQADALTKVLFVSGYERALAVADQWQVQALVVHKSGEWQMTQGLPVV